MTKKEFERFLNEQYATVCIDAMPIELTNYLPKNAAGHHKYSDIGTRIRRRDKTLFKSLFNAYKAFMSNNANAHQTKFNLWRHYGT